MHTDYISRINKSIDYIEANPEKSITLDELASAASFSRFHFSRIFHSLTGETPSRFILRVRLERAASLMLVCPAESITGIAVKCGFTDISVFSRNFRNHFQVAPSVYRRSKLQNSKISQLNSKGQQEEVVGSVYFCRDLQIIKWTTNMELNKSVEVRELPEMTLAYVRSIGPYNGDQVVFQNLRNKLFSWAGARGLLGRNDFRFLVMYHDDPNVAVGDNLRMSLCITVPPDTRVTGEIGRMELKAATYAIARFELTGSQFQEAWDWIYSRWLPSSGYQPDDKPCFEMYAGEPDNGNYVIDICIPVIPA